MKPHIIAAALCALSLQPLLATRAVAENDAREKRHGLSAEDFSALADSRIAALKAGLKLTPDQEKNWPALETALRDMGKARAANFAEHKEQMKADDRDTLDMLRHRATMLSQRAQELNKLADAAKPLYDSLDEGQKRRFGILLRQAGGIRPFGHFRWGRHGAGGDD